MLLKLFRTRNDVALLLLLLTQATNREATTHTMHSSAEMSETYSADFSTNKYPKTMSKIPTKV